MARTLLAILMALHLSQSRAGSLGSPATCDKSVKAGKLCSLAAADVRPTQLVLGMQEVRMKTAKFSAMSSSDLGDYLAQNPVPCVMGPEETFHATDHHHLLASLLASDHKDKDLSLIHI